MAMTAEQRNEAIGMIAEARELADWHIARARRAQELQEARQHKGYNAAIRRHRYEADVLRGLADILAGTLPVEASSDQ